MEGVPEGMSLKASDVSCCPDVEAASVEGDGTEDVGLIWLVGAAAGGAEGRVTFDRGEGRGWGGGGGGGEGGGVLFAGGEGGGGVGALLSLSLVLLLVGLQAIKT